MKSMTGSGMGSPFAAWSICALVIRFSLLLTSVGIATFMAHG